MESHLKTRLMLFTLIAVIFSSVNVSAQTKNASEPSTALKTKLISGYGRLPLQFEPNMGQTDRRVRFTAKTGSGTLFLTDTEAVLTIPQRKIGTRSPIERFDPKHKNELEKLSPTKFSVLRMKLTGTRKPVQTAGIEKLQGIVNYFHGNDPKKWHSKIPTFRKAKFAGIYKGVDMVYYGAKDGKLEYDFVVKPGADPRQIKLAFSGASNSTITDDGYLALKTDSGTVCWHKPVTYQSINGKRQQVACAYKLEKADGVPSVQFAVARYDTSKLLVIDPSLQYSTYLGGSDVDSGFSIVVEPSGNAYIAGLSSSTNFPTSLNAFQNTISGGYDAFITKLSADGSTLLYSTYLGGGNTDYCTGIVLDKIGNLYATGVTDGGFPVTPGAFQTVLAGNQDAFVSKLSLDGSALLYSTYLGGSDTDYGYGIAVDKIGNAYVTGTTYSLNFPHTAGAFQTALPGQHSAYITKLSTNGSSLLYSTYFGGSVNDDSYSIAVDSNENAYITGSTYSIDFPTSAGAFQTVLHGLQDAFITKLSVDGSSLIYSTYLGGLNYDYCNSIAVDDNGHAYVTGTTSSSNFPTSQGVFQMTSSGLSGEVFVTKLNIDASALDYSTYIGGSGNDEGIMIKVDTSGCAYVSGKTTSSNFPITNDAIQTKFGGGNFDAFTIKLSSNGSELIYSSYIGGSGDDYGLAIVNDTAGNIFMTGVTSSSDFPTTIGSFEKRNNGDGIFDSFVTKISFEELVNLTVTPNIVSSGSLGIGTVMLSTIFSSNTIIALSSSNPSVTVPSSVTILAGNTSAAFSVSTSQVLVDTPVTISAMLNGITKQATLLVTPTKILSLKLSSTSVIGGKTSTGKVNLSTAAPVGGFAIDLSSTNIAATVVPLSVIVPGGSLTATFPITTNAVSTLSSSTISASFGGISKSVILTVQPPKLSSLSLKSSSEIGGIGDMGIVKLTGIAPAGGVAIDLNSSAPEIVSLPSSIIIPAGAISTTFPITTVAVSSNITVGIHAIYNGVNKPATLTVKAPALISLSLKPTTVKGGVQNSIGTITLSGGAPMGGVVVTLNSSDASAASVPASITIPSGSKTAAFPITSLAVAIQKKTVISSTLGTLSKSSTLTVKP